MRVYPYIRISSTNRGHWADERATQLHAITAWAIASGHEVSDLVFVDSGISGTTDPSERDGWNELLDTCTKFPEESIIGVTSADRIARNGVFQEIAIQSVQAIGISVADVDGLFTRIEDEDDSAWLVRNILQLFVEFERRKIVKRLARGKARVKAEGGYTGGKQKIDFDCDTVYALHDKGLTERAIAEEMEISKSTVHRCLVNRDNP